MVEIKISDKDSNVLNYIISNKQNIGEEITLSEKGSVEFLKKNDIDYLIDPIKKISGLTIKLFDNYSVKIKFESSSYFQRIISIQFYSDDINILNCEFVKIKNNEGKLTDIQMLLSDPYSREDSKHDLNKGWDFFIYKMNNEFYQPYLNKINSQNLHKDILLEKYLRDINKYKI